MCKDDNISIDAIVKECTPLIKKYCMTFKDVKNYADDITNDVMTFLVEKWDTLRKDNIKAWLFRVADKFIKRYSSKLSKERDHITESIESLEEQNKEPISNDDYTPFVFENNIDKWKQEVYQKLIDDEKILYDLRYNQKLTLQQISEKISIPYTTLHDKYNQLEEKSKIS